LNLAVTQDFGELALVERTTMEGIFEWEVQRFRKFRGAKGPLPPEAKEKSAEFLRPLTEQMQANDELWFARSRKIGPLYGNEGVALVRNGEIIGYKKYIQR
jgi:hypothetical protein